MKRNHLTHCLVGLGAAVGVLVALGVQAGTLVYLAAALACPLMMVLMMGGMMRVHGHRRTSGDRTSEPGTVTSRSSP